MVTSITLLKLYKAVQVQRVSFLCLWVAEVSLGFDARGAAMAAVGAAASDTSTQFLVFAAPDS
jgi:hypothetical protein